MKLDIPDNILHFTKEVVQGSQISFPPNATTEDYMTAAAMKEFWKHLDIPQATPRAPGQNPETKA
ncbi:MAG: hypothetical protein AB7O68_16930 [Pirellulales bacterium]